MVSMEVASRVTELGTLLLCPLAISRGRGSEIDVEDLVEQERKNEEQGYIRQRTKS